MPIPGFGYSAGDFIATIEVIAKVITAFKDSGGASEEYRQLLHQLETLLGLLKHLSSIRSTDSNLTHVNAIKVAAISCRAPLQEFLDKTTRRYTSLEGSQNHQGNLPRTAAKLMTAGRKVHWAVFMEKNIERIRGMIGPSVININLLLGLIQL